MIKLLSCMVLAMALSLGGSAISAKDITDEPVNPANPVDQFTGNYWVNTVEPSKKAYLYGIESAIAVDYFINAKIVENAAKAGKKPGFVLSPFEKGWIAAFKDTPRTQIMDGIDRWYAEHPDQLDTPVLTVIWKELIEPRLDAQAKK